MSILTIFIHRVGFVHNGKAGSASFSLNFISTYRSLKSVLEDVFLMFLAVNHVTNFTKSWLHVRNSDHMVWRFEIATSIFATKTENVASRALKCSFKNYWNGSNHDSVEINIHVLRHKLLNWNYNFKIITWTFITTFSSKFSTPEMSQLNLSDLHTYVQLNSSAALQILSDLASVLVVKTRQLLVEFHVSLVDKTYVGLVAMSPPSAVLWTFFNPMK